MELRHYAIRIVCLLLYSLFTNVVRTLVTFTTEVESLVFERERGLDVQTCGSRFESDNVYSKSMICEQEGNRTEMSSFRV